MNSSSRAGFPVGVYDAKLLDSANLTVRFGVSLHFLIYLYADP